MSTRQEIFAEEERMAHLLRCHISREHARLIIKSTDERIAQAIATYDKPDAPDHHKALLAAARAEQAYRMEH
ncbi:MAG: hypothetical protein ACOY4R_27595 [Pseudomonadota bacterium]